MNNNVRWDDLVFDGRNKDYGAYDLRKAYGGRVIAAFIVALIALGLVMAYPTIKKLFEKEVIVEKPKRIIDYTKLEAPPPIDAAKEPPPKVELPPEVKETIKFLPPVITDKEVVDELPTIDDLSKVEPAQVTNEGEAEVVFDEVVPEAFQEEAEDPNKIYTIVEQGAEFPGGMQAMMKFIGQNMKYPPQARRMGIEGSVFVEFVVNATGTIQDAKVIKGIGGGCDEEALRVIAKMPTWKPGKQNGKPVRVKFVLPVKFLLG